MILDLTDQIMISYAPTTSGTTIANTSTYIDRLAKMEDGAGSDVEVFINVATAATSTGSATVQFQVVGNATDTTFASNNKVLFDSGAIAVATLVAGYEIPGKYKRQPFTSGQPNSAFYRYETILVTIVTPGLTAGVFNGWIFNGPVQDNAKYPAGYTVA